MKRILISLAAAALMPAFAQTANPGAKVDPKNNKVSNPVVEKPKVKLMTRDQLRHCFDMSDANALEAEAVKADQATYKENATKLKAEKEALQKADEETGAAMAAMKTEREGILKEFEDIKAAAPKLEKAELEARNKAYQERAAAYDARATAVNASVVSGNAGRKAFSEKVDAFNASFKALEDRQEAYLDKVDAWKAECGNKPYDEADEKAVKKERAAAGK